MTGLNTKNSDIIDLITATNNKLDAILTALGAPPPTSTVTLADIKDVLEDIKSAVVPIEQAINDLKAYLIDTMGERLPESIFTIWNMQREILTAAGGILDNTETIAQINTHLESITNILIYSASNLGLDPGANTEEYTGFLFDTLNWLGRISGALGVPIEANNRDVIQLLAKMADRPESQIGSGLAPYDICSNAYISSGMTLIPYNVLQVLQNIVFAVFPDPPPTGVSFGTVFGIGVDNTELHHDDGWGGWEIYVASSANNFALNGEDISSVLNRYPTNVWLDLGFLTTNLSVFVSGGDSLRVYLCSDGWGPGRSGGGPWGGGSTSGGTWGDCVTIESVLGTYSNDVPFSRDAQFIVFSSIPGLETGNTWFAGGNNQQVSVADTITTTNMNGVTVTLISGSSVDIHFKQPDGNTGSFPLGAAGNSQTINVDTTVVLIDNLNASSPSTSSFTVEICPPASP